MSFGKSTREVVPLQGTETGRMPDYVKIPFHDRVPQPKQSPKGRPSLPTSVPLKKAIQHHRVDRISGATTATGTKSSDRGSSTALYYPSFSSHPLEHPSGRTPLPVPHIAEQIKITQRSVDKNELARIRRTAFQERQMNRMQGRGNTDEHFLGKHA